MESPHFKTENYLGYRAFFSSKGGHISPSRSILYCSCELAASNGEVSMYKTLKAPDAMPHVLIPIPSHDIPWTGSRFAQLRVHSERIALGIWVNLFHASQQ